MSAASTDATAAPRSSSRVAINRILTALSLTPLAALLVGAATPLLPRNPSFALSVFAWIAFLIQVFRFPIGITAGIIAVVAARRRAWIDCAALAAAAAIGLAPAVLAFLPHRPAPNAPTVRVMSLNLLKGRADPTLVIAEIDRHRPDIVCLQEYNAAAHAALADELNRRFSQSLVAPTPAVRGAAVYSRLPIRTNTDSIFDFGLEGGPQIQTTVEIVGRPVELLCIHLAQPKRRSSFARQQVEIRRLAERLAGLNCPIIVVGDLNCTEGTSTFAVLERGGFADTTAITGTPRQPTWASLAAVPWLRLLQLDHIMLSRGLSASRTWVGGYVGSDHRPVFTEVGFSP